ncbi:MAG: SUF system Fe-S cluster assembly regulator [Xanthomonadales bacterium]|nr:SUF system Fe-S cluster assembly regulator [Xanthomonadales bacterium]
MLRLSKLTDYAIMLLSVMAEDPEQVLSASELAGRAHLEQTTVAKILKILTKSGLIRSYRGVNGGYRPAVAPRDLSVADVIGAMEGPIGMTECSVTPGLCAQEAYCQVQKNWQRISLAVENALADVTLEDMTRPMVPPVGVRNIRVVTRGKL